MKSLKIVGAWLLLLVALAVNFQPVATLRAGSGYPISMGSAGDSITQAASTENIAADAPQNNWSTGTNATSSSHYLRILAANPAIDGKNFNVAVSGSKMDALNGQLTNLVSSQPQYITILMGGNDICSAASENELTPLATFRSQFQLALDNAKTNLPNSRFFVGSVVDIYRLWELFKNNQVVTAGWNFFNICRPMLYSSGDMPADEARRLRVRQRIVEYNQSLQEICATYFYCQFDNNAIFNNPFGTAEVAGDYFHPSKIGQAKIATATYAVSFSWTDQTAPTLTPTVLLNNTGISLTLTASDTESRVRAEYRINGGAWQIYTSTVNITSGGLLYYRARDAMDNLSQEQAVSLVTESSDNLATPTPGMFSFALANLATASDIYFAVAGGRLMAAGSYTIPANTRLYAACSNNGPSLTLDGTNLGGSATHGLTLSGNIVINGLKIHGFNGNEVIAKAGQNKLSCFGTSQL